MNNVIFYVNFSLRVWIYAVWFGPNSTNCSVITHFLSIYML